MKWERVTVFISSTFNDMHAERDYLVKDVFPELREWCEERKIHLVDVDLRWGVTEEDSNSNHTVLACLNNIDESRPFFLCFLGQRRGWVPEKKDISSNTVDEYPDIVKAVGRNSVTEMEIEHALLSPMRHIVNGNEKQEIPVRHALFYFRNPKYLGDLTSDQRVIFTNEAEKDITLADRELIGFKEKIKVGCYQAVTYDCQWNKKIISPELPEKVRQGRLTDFSVAGKALKDTIVEQLKAEITKEFPDREKVGYASGLDRDLDQQALFIELNSEGFIPREGDFDDLNGYVTNHKNDLFILTAPAGSGKSMLLSNFIIKESKKHNARFFNRFCGVSDLCSQQYSLWKTIFDEARIGCPDTLNDLKNKIGDLLKELAKEKTVLIIDAINQLPDGLDMPEWLPKQLPANLKIILSLKEYEKENENVSKSTVKPFHNKEEKRKLINDYLKKYLKALDDKQIDTICGFEGSKNPLYLKIVLSELRIFGSFEQLPREMQQFGETPQKAFNYVLNRLENDVNSLAIEPKVFAPLLFGLLANARNGLSEKELTACMQKELGMEEEKLIRGIRLYLRQVRPFMTRREGRADYFYEAFKLAAKERYQKDTIHYNKLLSDYFNEQADPGHTLSFKGKNIRDFNELPYHLKESEHITYLEKILSTYCWIKSKIELSDVFHVIGDYDYMDLENEDYYHLELIKNTLTMSAHLLKEDTKSLPTQLWGRLKGIENPRIKELLLEVDKYTDYPWLKPRHYMDSPENALKMTLTGGGHSCFSPDGKYVASTGSENAIRVWEWKKQKEVQVLYSAGHCLCFSPDGKYIAAGYGLTVRIWEWENAKEMQKLEGHTGTVYSVCFFFDGKYIATISKDRTIRVWDWKKQKEIQRLEGHEVYCVCVSPDGKYIASTSVDRYGDTIRIWDWKKAKEIQKLEELYKKVMYLCFSSDGKYIITGSDSGISIWDWEKGIQKLKEHTNELGCICASPDGKYIALAEFFDNIVKIWNTENWTEVRRLIHPDSVGSVCFSPDGKYISSGLADSVKIWEWEKQEDKRKSGGGTAQIYSVSFSPDGKCIVFGGDQGIKIWDWETQEETQRFDDNIFVRYVCFSPDGKYIASSFNDKTIRVWEWKKQEVVQELGSTEVDSVCFSPDGKYIVSTDNSIVRIWDWKNQKEIKELETDNKSDNKCVCFSPDGKYIITGSVKAVSIWDWENAKEIQILREDFGAIESACFSPNGKYIVTGSSFGTIRVWDWENAKEIQKLELKSSDNYVRDVCFSNDGKYILMVSRHYIIRIWEWEIQTQVIVLNAEESIECCNFSNDSRQIAVGGWSGQVLMYDVENLYPSDKYVENSGDTDSNQKKKGFFSGLFKR